MWDENDKNYLVLNHSVRLDVVDESDKYYLLFNLLVTPDMID